MKLYVPYNKINPISNEKDDTLFGLALGTLALGVQPVATSDRQYVIYSSDNDKVPLQVADLISSKGVLIKEFPLFIEIDSKTTSCPFLKNGTWEDWKLDNHTFYEVGDRIFIGTNAHTNEDMDWADIQIVRNDLVLAGDLPVNDMEE